MRQPEEGVPKRYFSIGEVAEMLQVNTSLLRFWEAEFPQIQPRKTRKGRRMYTRKDVEVIKSIHYLLRVRKYTLEGARAELLTQPEALAQTVQLRETLLLLKNFLQGLRERF